MSEAVAQPDNPGVISTIYGVTVTTWCCAKCNGSTSQCGPDDHEPYRLSGSAMSRALGRSYTDTSDVVCILCVECYCEFMDWWHSAPRPYKSDDDIRPARPPLDDAEKQRLSDILQLKAGTLQLPAP